MDDFLAALAPDCEYHFESGFAGWRGFSTFGRIDGQAACWESRTRARTHYASIFHLVYNIRLFFKKFRRSEKRNSQCEGAGFILPVSLSRNRK